MQTPDSQPIQPSPSATIPQLNEDEALLLPQESDRESEQNGARDTQGPRSTTAMKAIMQDLGRGDTGDLQTRTSSAPMVLTSAAMASMKAIIAKVRCLALCVSVTLFNPALSSIEWNKPLQSH